MNVSMPLLFLLGAGSILLADDVKPPENLPIAQGPFKPTMDSLEQYQCPQWFRDAKFGIWAHWGPQAVPMEGDWYARKIYEQGSDDYNYHVAHYGHPSKFGYKDIIPLWKAEKWDPDHLMSLYKKAGAQYFVSMGSHHDNFFVSDARTALHPWLTSKRPVVAGEECALRQGPLESGSFLITRHGGEVDAI